MKLKDKLLLIGVKQDAIDQMIELFYRIVKIDDSSINEGGGCYLTYKWLEDHFQSTEQGWSELKKIVRDKNNILICDYIYSYGSEDKKDNKAFKFWLSLEWHELLQDFLFNDLFNNEDNKNVKIWNVKRKSLKERLRRQSIKNIPYIYPSMYYHHLDTVKVDNTIISQMFSSFIDFSSMVSFSKETEIVIKRKKEALRYVEGKAKESLMSAITTDLICLKQIKSGSMKFELSKDGRWHQNGWIGLSTEVKRTLECQGMKNLNCLDIRSCHGTFFGIYLRSIDSSISLSEVLKWNAVFLGEEKPVVYFQRKIKDILHYNASLKLIKDVLNKYFNGSGRDEETNELRKDIVESSSVKKTLKAIEYVIAEEFPELIKAWKKTKIKETGINISRFFEQKITQDGRIYQLAKEIGVVIVQEHDGFSIFSKDDVDLSPISNLISSISDELFGIKIKVVNKGNIERKGFEYFQSDEEVLATRNNEVRSMRIALDAINSTLKKLGGRYSKLKEIGQMQKANETYSEITKQKKSKEQLINKIEKFEFDYEINN